MEQKTVDDDDEHWASYEKGIAEERKRVLAYIRAHCEEIDIWDLFGAIENDEHWQALHRQT